MTREEPHKPNNLRVGRLKSFVLTTGVGFVTGLILGEIALLQARSHPHHYGMAFLEHYQVLIGGILGTMGGAAFWIVRPLRARRGGWLLVAWMIVSASSFGIYGACGYLQDPRPVVGLIYGLLVIAVGVGFAWFDDLVHRIVSA
jgi:hypothetical protein